MNVLRRICQWLVHQRQWEKLAQLQRLDLLAYVDYRLDTGVKASSINAELAVFRVDSQRRDHHTRAVMHFDQAVRHWEAYARAATSQYRPQLFSRTHYMDWWKILEQVKQEAKSVAEEAR